jgi:hypothetical protein
MLRDKSSKILVAQSWNGALYSSRLGVRVRLNAFSSSHFPKEYLCQQVFDGISWCEILFQNKGPKQAATTT